MRPEHLVVIYEDGEERFYPLREWVRENVELVHSPDRTTHQLRDELKQKGWTVRKSDQQALIYQPGREPALAGPPDAPLSKVTHPPELEITRRLANVLRERFSPDWTILIDGKLPYALTETEQRSHKNDILMSGENRHVAIEVKFRSSVTDQFKARSFDACHLKKQYGDGILTMMVFVRADRGLKPAAARSLCHWFDLFFDYRFEDIGSTWGLETLIAAISDFEAEGRMRDARLPKAIRPLSR